MRVPPMLEVTCPTCGKALKADESAAGRTVRCPGCLGRISIPPITPKPAEKAIEPPLPSRPFWKDPVVVIGAAVPTIILVVFFGYLLSERSARLFRDRVVSMKEEGDRLHDTGDERAALYAYGRLLEYIGGRSLFDPQLRADVEAARRAHASLEAKLKPILEKEAADRRRAELERLEAETSNELEAASRRLDAEKSPAAIANVERALAHFRAVQDRLSAPYWPLLEEAARYFPDTPSEIGMIARGSQRYLKQETKPVEADPVEIVKGGFFLLKNSHYPDRGMPGSPHEIQSFRAYTTQYEYWRKDGLSHQQAIDRMYELRKF